MTDSSGRGFTLVEIAVVILLLGMMFAFAVPAFRNISNTYQLKGATQNIAAQLRLAREKAIATGASQTMHFTLNFPAGTDYDYHIHNGATVGPSWALPRGISYYSVGVNPVMSADGRSDASGNIILQDQKGHRDTVSVQLS